MNLCGVHCGKNEEPTDMNMNEGLNSNLDGQHDSGGTTKAVNVTLENEIHDPVENNEEPKK